jgi:hypothetical protein
MAGIHEPHGIDANLVSLICLFPHFVLFFIHQLRLLFDLVKITQTLLLIDFGSLEVYHSLDNTRPGNSRAGLPISDQ